MMRTLLHLPEEAAHHLELLGDDQAFFYGEGFSSAKRIRIEPHSFGAPLTEAENAKRVAKVTAQFSSVPVNSETRETTMTEVCGSESTSTLDTSDAASVSCETSPLLDEYLAALRILAQDLNLSVTEFYNRANYSSGRGHRIKSQLIATGLIQVQRQRSSNGRPRDILILTQKGKEAIREK